jgi:sulfofructose kinase
LAFDPFAPLREPLFDVLGLGIVTVDDLLYVTAYPPPETKVRVLHRTRQGGGLTCTALVAASRLGSRCAYAGVLGSDDLSQFVRATFRREGIDLEHVSPLADVPPIHSTIVVDQTAGTRTIFFERADDLGDSVSWPPAELIRSARVLFVDHKHAETMIRAARIAREAGLPVVADFERAEAPQFPELLALTDHLILGRDLAARLTGANDPRAAVEALWTEGRAAVVVTCGAEGCWSLGDSPAGKPRHQPAFAVQVVDTTGCGDVFHGAYASALARGADLAERVRFASAAAALKATAPGGQAGIPSRAAVDAYLAKI